MSEYTLSQVSPTDKTTLAEIDALLQKEGIRRDGNLDYICAMFDEDYHVIGTGSCFGNTLRCFAVSSDHQGEGLLNQIITHLIEVQCARGNLHLFLYTKAKSSKFFGVSGPLGTTLRSMGILKLLPVLKSVQHRRLILRITL